MVARQAKRKRRAFGACKHVNRHGHPYLEYSYPTPSWAFSQWPDLPARCYRVVAPEFAWEGEAWLAAAQTAIKARTWTPPQVEKERDRRESLTFREYAESWLKERHTSSGAPIRETTRHQYRRTLDIYLLPVFGDMALANIKPKNIRKWWDDFKPLTPGADLESRRAYVYRHLTTIMRSAASEPIDSDGNTLIASSPCTVRAATPQPKHVPVRPTREQFEALVSALPERMRLVARICDGAALREGEALALCVKHIDFDRMKINVEQQVQRVPDPKRPGHYDTAITPPKTASSTAAVAMSPRLASKIREWMDANHLEAPDQRLFTSASGDGWISPQTYRNAVARARKQVPGLETLRPHDLRKDSLSTLIENGGTVSEAMRQGRHRSLAVASKYQIVADDHMTEVLKRVDASAVGTPSSNEDGKAPGDAAAGGLAGVLAAMTLEERVAVLRALPDERRTAALNLLPSSLKVETVTALLAGPP